MLIAPLSRNLLARASTSITTASTAFQVGAPANNLWDEDFGKRAIWRGPFTVVAGVNDKIDGNDGAPFVATLTAGTYPNVMLFCAEVARALNAASTLWTCYPNQNANPYYRIEIARSAGTGSFQIATGANAATNALYLLAGFRNEDRTAAATHVGDIPARMGFSAYLNVDFASPLAVSGMFMAGLNGSPALLAHVQTGDADPAASEVAYCGAYDDECMWAAFATPASRRYALVTLSDSRSEEDDGRVEVGYLWLGRWWDSDVAGRFDRLEYETGSLKVSLEQRATIGTRLDGYPVISEVAPGERISMAWQGAPGVGPSMIPGLEDLIRDLGVNGYAFIATTVDGPLRGGRLCRLVSMPSIEQLGIESMQGRFKLALEWEVQVTR